MARRLTLMGSASAPTPAAAEDPKVLKAMATVMRKQVAGGQRLIIISDRAALVIADLLEQQATPSAPTT